MKTIVKPEPPPTLIDLFGRADKESAAEETHAMLTSMGRTAYIVGLRSLGLSSGAKILLPALCCKALVTATETVGAIPVFYDVRDDLSPDLEELEEKADNASALVIIHYFGFPQRMEELLDFCSRTNILMIEDCAHALYSRLEDRSLGSFGTFSFFSIRKFLPVPCGGMLVFNDVDNLPLDNLPRSWRYEILSTARHLLRYAENRIQFSPRTALLKWEGLRRTVARSDAEASPKLIASARLSQKVFFNSEAHAIVARRRRNFQFLLDTTEDLAPHNLLHSWLEEGVNPMGFPLITRNRSTFIKQMLREKIIARPVWPELPEGVDESAYPIASGMGRRLLYVPIHQDLKQTELIHIGNVLRKCLENDADEEIFDS